MAVREIDGVENISFTGGLAQFSVSGQTHPGADGGYRAETGVGAVRSEAGTRLRMAA